MLIYPSILTDAYSITYGFVMSIRYANNSVEIYMNGARVYTYAMPFVIGRMGFGINSIIGASVGINNLQWSDILQENIEKSAIADTQNLLVSGDSITFGEGASVSWADFLPNLLEGKRGIQKVNINNIAVSGSKIGDQLTLMQGMDLSSYTAFLIMIGVNDIQSATNYTTFKTSLQSIITLSNGKPVVIGYPTMFISRTLTGTGYATSNYNKGAMIREAILSIIADNANVYLADTLSQFGRIGVDNSSNVLRDNVHLQTSAELLAAKSFAKSTIAALANDKLNIPITTLNNGGYVIPTLSNGWVNNGGGYEPARFYKDASGNIHISGIIKNGTYANGTTIFTLPVGYRPAYHIPIECAYSGGTYTLQIASTGIVSIFAAPGTAPFTLPPQAWISIGCRSFRTD